MTNIADRLRQVRARIEEVALACGRQADEIRLVAASKAQGVDAIVAAVECGQREFGENQLQEALPKLAALRASRLTWHFIGPIQSNKTRGVGEHFDWVHALDRVNVAARMNEQRPPQMPALNVCIQINTSGETSKSGVTPDAALELARQVMALPRLRLRGIMAVPRPSDDVTVQLENCLEVRAVYERQSEEHTS